MGIEVKFYNKTAGEYDGLLWDFGDGTTSADENPVHLYAEEGLYEIILTVGDSVFNQEIEVACPELPPPPIRIISVSKVSVVSNRLYLTEQNGHELPANWGREEDGYIADGGTDECGVKVSGDPDYGILPEYDYADDVAGIWARVSGWGSVMTGVDYEGRNTSPGTYTWGRPSVPSEVVEHPAVDANAMVVGGWTDYWYDDPEQWYDLKCGPRFLTIFTAVDTVAYENYIPFVMDAPYGGYLFYIKTDIDIATCEVIFAYQYPGMQVFRMERDDFLSFGSKLAINIYAGNAGTWNTMIASGSIKVTSVSGYTQEFPFTVSVGPMPEE